MKLTDYNKFITANWKMNGSLSLAEQFESFFLNKFNNLKNLNAAIILCPPTPYLFKFKKISKKFDNFFIGAQDCSTKKNGSITGDVSSTILKDLGCEFVILGHSERRLVFKENEEVISKKIHNSLKENIIPIFCIGENLQQKKEKLTKEVLEFQILKSLPKNIDLNKIIIAYEPVWSIGTGLIPKIEEISDTHHFIKNTVLRNNNTKVLYGGSVKANNYKRILDAVNVDGLLIGGASLNLDEFNQILNF